MQCIDRSKNAPSEQATDNHTALHCFRETLNQINVIALILVLAVMPWSFNTVNGKKIFSVVMHVLGTRTKNNSS